MWLVDLHRSSQILAGWFCLVNPKADFWFGLLQHGLLQQRPQVHEVLISNGKHRKHRAVRNQVKRDVSDWFCASRCYLMTWNALGMHLSDLSGEEAHDSDGYHRGLHCHSVLSSIIVHEKDP